MRSDGAAKERAQEGAADAGGRMSPTGAPSVVGAAFGGAKNATGEEMGEESEESGRGSKKGAKGTKAAHKKEMSKKKKKKAKTSKMNMQTQARRTAKKTPPPKPVAPPVVRPHVSSFWVNVGSSFFTRAEFVGDVDAVGEDQPLRFQWRSNGIDLPGATSAYLSISSVGKDDGGTYTCAVSNAAGTVVWEEVIVHVTEPPTTTPLHQRKHVKLGWPITIKAEAAGEPAPSFQWRKNGVNVVAAAGGRGPALEIAKVQLTDAGTYTCLVTNIGGSAIWEELVLDVYT